MAVHRRIRRRKRNRPKSPNAKQRRSMGILQRTDGNGSSLVSRTAPLTPNLLRILRYRLQGLKPRAIALLTGRARRTIYNHLFAIRVTIRHEVAVMTDRDPPDGLDELGLFRLWRRCAANAGKILPVTIDEDAQPVL